MLPIPSEGVVVLVTTLEGEQEGYILAGQWFISRPNDDDGDLPIDDEEVISWRPM